MVREYQLIDAKVVRRCGDVHHRGEIVAEQPIQAGDRHGE
jgi:hypothetical protein